MNEFDEAEYSAIRNAAIELYQSSGTTPSLDKDVAAKSGVHVRRVRKYLIDQRGRTELVDRGLLGVEPESKVLPNWATDPDGRRLSCVGTAYRKATKPAFDIFKEINGDILDDSRLKQQLMEQLLKIARQLGPKPTAADRETAISHGNFALRQLLARERDRERGDKHFALANIANEKLRLAGLLETGGETALITESKIRH